jgi:pyridoxamine 5'-phosphate oxidase
MNFKDCIKFANENPTSYIATVDGDQPRVRGFWMWFADETGFYFHTGAMKPVYSQLKKNSKVEACFFHPAEDGGIMMRVAGTVEFLDDTELRGKLIEERQFLKAWGFTAENPELVIFRIAKGGSLLLDYGNQL